MVRFLKRLFGGIPFEPESVALYSTAVTQARQPVFYNGWGVPDTVDGRFDMVTLHVYLILHRLKGQGDEAEALAQALFDTMFKDMDNNLRVMGVSDMRIGNRVKDLAQRLYGRADAYDKGLAADDGTLEDALKRNAFQGTDGDVAAMAAYLRRETAAMAAQEIGDMLKGEVRFGQPGTEDGT